MATVSTDQCPECSSLLLVHGLWEGYKDFDCPECSYAVWNFGGYPYPSTSIIEVDNNTEDIGACKRFTEWEGLCDLTYDIDEFIREWAVEHGREPEEVTVTIDGGDAGGRR